MEKSWKFVGKNVYEPCTNQKNKGMDKKYWVEIIQLSKNKWCYVDTRNMH